MEADLEKLRGHYDAVCAERDEIKQQLLNVVSGASSDSAKLEAMLAEQTAAEKERRIELLSRQITRRIMNRDIAIGFMGRAGWRAKPCARYNEARVRAAKDEGGLGMLHVLGGGYCTAPRRR